MNFREVNEFNRAFNAEAKETILFSIRRSFFRSARAAIHPVARFMNYKLDLVNAAACSRNASAAEIIFQCFTLMTNEEDHAQPLIFLST